MDVRTTLGGTLGRRILQTNEAILFVFAGAQLNRERFFNEPSRRTAEAIFHVELQQFRFDTPKLDSTTAFDFLPNLSDPPSGSEGNDFGISTTLGYSY